MAKVLRVRDEDDQVTAEIAKGVEVSVVRSTITAVVSKTEPVADSKTS